MAQVGLDVLFTGYTGNLIVVWKKASAPLTEVGRSNALPFPVDQVIVAPNLSLETYNFEFWQSADGTSLDTLIRPPWSIDASSFDEAIAKAYEYVVDRGHTNVTEGTGAEVWADPATGDFDITDERLLGVVKSDIQVETRGVGRRRTDEWDLKSGGGITLTDPNEPFTNGDTIIVTVLQKTSSQPQPQVSTEYSDVKVVSADANVDATFKNKLIICDGAAPVITLTFPAFNTLVDQKMKFSTHGMTGNYLTLQFAVGNTVSFAGANRNVIYLTAGRIFEMMWKNNVAYVLSDIGQAGYDVRGNRQFADDVKPHQLLLDGDVRQIDDFPGIIEWIKTLAPAQRVGTFVSWDTDANKRKYYLNEGAGEFALPDDRDMHYRALKTFDGGNGMPGLYTPDQLMTHEHEQTIGTLNIEVFGRGVTSRKKGNYDKQQDGITDLTGPPINADGSALISGNENNVKAVRQYAVINM